MNKRRNMVMGRLALIVVCIVGALGLAGAAFVLQARLGECKYIPLLASELLPNATLQPGDPPRMPAGWSSAAAGVELESFDLDGDGRALQLIGIGNYVQTPPVPATTGASFCFTGKAITDSPKRSPTRLRVVFRWLDAARRVVAEDVSGWQPVVLWRDDARPDDWSRISAAFRAPTGATTLVVRLQPASDDRIYLDDMHIRRSTSQDRTQITVDQQVQLHPWPNGARAALSFSFDWETAMGGLVHSRSIDDPNSNLNPIQRGLRMREGVTTTLELFRPHGIRATYYANGYNFLLGNTEKRQFMSNPIFKWADTQTEHRWRSDRWATTPWFADDPYGTYQSDPAWYFGDLVPLLLREQHDIQSHTFSHLHVGFARTTELQADLAAWTMLASEQAVPKARSLAFPWSGSNGISDADWDALEQAGITSVTRTYWEPKRAQYHLVDRSEPRCRPVPGHERILACPDFYLTEQYADQAITMIDRAIAAGGMIDLWAHTEEVVMPEEITAWRTVVEYAVKQRNAGQLWIAPLAEIADWQQALDHVTISTTAHQTRSAKSKQILAFSISNTSVRDLKGLTLQVPFPIGRISVDGQPLASSAVNDLFSLDLFAGQTYEVVIWPI